MALALTALGVVGSLVGIYALYHALSTARHKFLAYEASAGFAVAKATRIGGDYELSVHFKAAGGREEKIGGAYLQLIRFANLGREPIYGRDNAPGNPIRVEVAGARVLDIAIADVRRKVNQIELSPPTLSDQGGSARLSFDFLDYRDGALVRVLTVGEADSIKIVGDVIGMPSGIVCTSPGPTSQVSEKILMGSWLVAELVLLGATAFVIRSVTGSWVDSWLLVLPIVAFLIPIFVLSWIDESGSRPRRVSWRRRAYPDFQLPGSLPFGRAFNFPVLSLEAGSIETTKDELADK